MILFIRNSQSEKSKILNKGLRLAMQFGKNWLNPVNERLKKLYPFLSDVTIDEYSSTCANVLNDGINYIAKTLSEAPNTPNKELSQLYNSFIIQSHPWISKSNTKALYKQALYYAHHDGLI